MKNACGENKNMNNPVKEIMEKASIINDISDIETIIRNYHINGFLDRTSACDKIVEIRMKDATVMAIAVGENARSSIPFDQVSEERIVEELMKQETILKIELAKTDR